MNFVLKYFVLKYCWNFFAIIETIVIIFDDEYRWPDLWLFSIRSHNLRLVRWFLDEFLAQNDRIEQHSISHNDSVLFRFLDFRMELFISFSVRKILLLCFRFIIEGNDFEISLFDDVDILTIVRWQIESRSQTL